MRTEEVAALPEVRALRPVGDPYLDVLSEHSDLQVWHVDVQFQEWPISEKLALRWSAKELNVRETWQKRPLASGEDSGCLYSCGEVEIAARLRESGFPSYWISEWSGFPHVPMWEPFCIKRSEFQQRGPELWAFDQKLRLGNPALLKHLGRSGGHPDVACITPGGYVYFEYKGPGDKIKPKQNTWAEALVARESPRVAYLAVRGTFRRNPSVQSAELDFPGKELNRSAVRSPEPRQVRTEKVARVKVSPSRGEKLPKLHRRTISDTLKKERGWSAVSRVDGWVDFWPKAGSSIDDFAAEVRQAVEAMNYTPTIRIGRDSSGRSIVRVRTPETLDQAPRGEHGA